MEESLFPKFGKVLVANRGEIAVRIIRALRDMNIRSVAVFSDADRTALHVRMADEAEHIGPSPSPESYLRIDRLLEGAKKHQAEAIHPGYGFANRPVSYSLVHRPIRSGAWVRRPRLGWSQRPPMSRLFRAAKNLPPISTRRENSRETLAIQCC